MFNGDRLKIMLFGESHGKCVGVCVEGLPHGLALDEDRIAEFSRKRKGIDALSTARREPDEVEIMSGVMNGVTTGAPLCAMIMNTDTRSRDYTPNIPRPSHADFVADGRYEGYNDYRGGGSFSGRLTAALVFVGAVCDMILEKKGVTTGVHVARIHEVCDKPLNMETVDKFTLDRLNKMDIPVFDEDVSEAMTKAVLDARAEGDSVGGVLECVAVGYPAFIGANYFGRLNSGIGQLVFSLPAFCGLEFGAGFEMANKKGSQVNDSICYEGEQVRTRTNNSGGINGGITNGMPIVVRCGVKPTPSVYKEQDTIDMNTGENIKHSIKGRHDPCIALRANVVLRSMMNIALVDGLLSSGEHL